MAKKITIKQKEHFNYLRRQGYSINYASKTAGFSYQSGRLLEKKRRSGKLFLEINKAKYPEREAWINEIINEAYTELTRRGLNNMSDHQIVSIINRGLSAMKTKSQKEDLDDLDRIWAEVTNEKQE